VNLRMFRRVPARKRGLIAVLAAAVAASTSLAIAGAGTAASAAPIAPADQVPASATGLGQLTGLLPASHLTLESTIQVDLSNETVRLPLYPGIAYKGTPHQEKVWYILEDASDAGARDPHRRPVQARPVRRVLGGHAVRQGLRRRPADRLPQH
jgi:hypothetical protein